MADSMRQIEVVRHDPASARPELESVVVEEPLEIRIGKVSLVVTMRTPGHDAELAAGFLLTEGVIGSHSDIEELQHCHDTGSPEGPGNVLVATLASSAAVDLERLKRNFLSNSSCGLCGKVSIDQVRHRVKPVVARPVRASLLFGLSDEMRVAQTVFSATGGLHAAAIFDAAGGLLCVREDIGRHNAVDKAIGWALLEDRLPVDGAIMLVSGRASFEIVQKALGAGIGVVAAISAASTLARELALESGMTLVGFLRDQRLLVYTGVVTNE